MEFKINKIKYTEKYYQHEDAKDPVFYNVGDRTLYKEVIRLKLALQEIDERAYRIRSSYDMADDVFEAADDVIHLIEELENGS